MNADSASAGTRAPEEPCAPIAPPARPAGYLGNIVHAVGAGAAMLASCCVAPLVRAMSWIRPHRAGAEPRALGALFAMIMDGPGAPPVPAKVTPRRGFAIHTSPAADTIEVSADLDAGHYQALCKALQRPGAKLLDLRPAARISMALFEQLADRWRAQAERVPRLAIVLDYERWTVFRLVAMRRLRPIVDRKIQVEILYEQQLRGAPAWFGGGNLLHDAPAVLAWLRTSWRPTPIWRTVLNTTAMLVHAAAPVEQVPDLLLELVAIAQSFGGRDGIEQAFVHAEAAMSWTGKTPSAARCRTLRAKAALLRRHGDHVAALAALDTALTVAMVIKDHVEEASTFSEIGAQALCAGHAARAEARFRTGLALLLNTDAEARVLRATLRHQLAAALLAQQDYDQAQQEAEAALALRGSTESTVAAEDRALLEQIHARRSATGAPPVMPSPMRVQER